MFKSDKCEICGKFADSTIIALGYNNENNFVHLCEKHLYMFGEKYGISTQYTLELIHNLRSLERKKKLKKLLS